MARLPWKETELMTERKRFVTLAQTERIMIIELAVRSVYYLNHEKIGEKGRAHPGV